MALVVPLGFPELTRSVRRYWGYRNTIPRSEEDMFDRLVHWTLLSGVTNSAQNIYLDDLIRERISYKRVDDRWSYGMRKVLERQRRTLQAEHSRQTFQERPAANIKMDAIRKLLGRITDVNETLLEAQEVIPRMWANERFPSWRNSPRVIDLVTQVAHERGAYKLHDVGFVKATKWIHNLGIGQQVVPPLRQNARFLSMFCGCDEFRRADSYFQSLGDMDDVFDMEVVYEWTRVNNRCRELAKRLGNGSADAQLVGDTIHLVMYVRGLFHNAGPARKISAESLMRFLKSNRISAARFMDEIYDVDTIPSLLNSIEEWMS